MRKTKIITIAVLTVAMLAAMTGIAAAGTYHLGGVVVDDQGNVLGGIKVQIYDAGTGELLGEAETHSAWDIWLVVPDDTTLCVYLEFPDGTWVGIGDLGEEKTCWTIPDEIDALTAAVERIQATYGGDGGPPENQDPIADANGPYEGFVGDLISFDGTGSYDPDGTIVSYEWDLDGDGVYDDATGATPNNTWNTPYSGTISLKVTDDDGAIATDSTSLTVIARPPENQDPIADANGPYEGFVGDLISFDGSGSDDPDGTIVSYEWDLDDDGEFDDATGSTPTKTWSNPYSGTISLKVTDNHGATNIDSTSIIVVELLPMGLKEQTITELEACKTGDKYVDRAINGVLSLIDNSLEEKYWIDDLHLDAKHGGKVFTYESLAVGDMELHTKLWEKRRPTLKQQQAIDVFQKVTHSLVEADKLLAKTALDEAHETTPPDKPNKLKAYQVALAKTDASYEKAQQYMDMGRPGLAILSYKHAWTYSQLAIKIAEGKNIPTEGITDDLEELKAIINDLPQNVYTTMPKLRQLQLNAKVDTVITMCNSGNYNGAYDKLINDLKPKLDSTSSEAWVKEPLPDIIYQIDDIASQLELLKLQ